MIFHETLLKGAYVVELSPLQDERGCFARVFCARTFREHGLVETWVQANQSLSLRRGTIRGLHYQRRRPRRPSSSAVSAEPCRTSWSIFARGRRPSGVGTPKS